MRRYLDAEVHQLDTNWRLAVTEAGAWADSAQIPATEFIAATVPGTVAVALTAAGQFDPEHPVPLQGLEAEYRCELSEPSGAAVLRFEGLATLAEVFLNGESILRSESMFEAHDVPVEFTGSDSLVIRFDALTSALSARGPRARWRPQLADNQGLRLVRTTLLGHMSGWCPSIQAVGPYRPVSVIRPGVVSLDQVQISAELASDGTGVLRVSCLSDAAGLSLHCGGSEAALVADSGRLSATLRIPQVEPWWPATHGRAALYDIEIGRGDQRWGLGRTGFRRLRIDRGDGSDFAVVVNDEPIFCRGAVWTNADLLGLSGTRETYAELLEQLAAAGANMVRIPGIATYEAPAFFDLCDELGILVFADFMFANFDYPSADEAFLNHVKTEVRQFLQARQGCPSLAVTCAGSEIAQQASMLGLPEAFWYSTLATEVLPALVAELRPDVEYVPGSPSGGPLPFSVNAGIGHYYGVGAYERPLDDARRAEVRFTSECLAFANVPDASNLARSLAASPVHDPRWKAGVPRDPGASWDFEDTRNHYLNRLYELDSTTLRRTDPASYLDYSRAVSTEVVTEVFSEWRSRGSSCRGALVFTLADLRPGAGWGVLDSDHLPKPVFRGLARAFRPVNVAWTDEGVNGLALHAINETGEPIAASVEIFGLRDGAVPVARAAAELTLQPRSTIALAPTDLLGGFFDYNYAYRFGPASHQVVVALLRIGTDVVAEAFHFPLGRSAALVRSELSVEVVQDEVGWALLVATDQFAQSVHVDLGGYAVEDDWFHLVPAQARLLRLSPLPGAATPPTGEVRSLAGAYARF